MNFRIKDICREKGIMLKDLANMIGITEVGLSKSLNGNPNIGRLEEIADALEVKVTDLFEKPAGEVNGYIELDGTIHKVSSKDDIKKLAENL